MSEKKEVNPYKKFILLLTGFVILVLGISLILCWWHEVIVFVKGFIGMALAISGLLMMYGLNKE